jgi:hypothetical protein
VAIEAIITRPAFRGNGGGDTRRPTIAVRGWRFGTKEWEKKIAYVRDKPVKRGVVRHWEDYPWTWPKDEA